MALTPSKNPGYNRLPILSSWINLAIESFRLNLPDHVTPGSHPIVHLAYWHCRLLGYLLMPSSRSADVFWAAKQIVKLLVQHPRLRSPLNHHFSALVCATLMELSDVAKTADEAVKLLRELQDKPFAQSAWDGAIMAALAEKLPRPGTGAGGGDSQSLQHLADLATATTDLAAATAAAATAAAGEGTAVAAVTAEVVVEVVEEPPIKYRTLDNYEDLGFDPRPMLRAGYLDYFNCLTSVASMDAGMAGAE